MVLRMDKLRRLPFLLALLAIAIAVSLEVGSGWFMRAAGERTEYATPGLSIRYLALLHGIILFNALYMGLSIIVPQKLTGLLQGGLTLIVSLGLVIGGVVLAFAAFELLTLMVALLFAAPFGTIAYFALFGHFPTAEAGRTVAAVMFLTLCFAGCLVIAHQGFLTAKALICLVLTALLATFGVRLLLTIVPGFLASITDAIGALLVAIVAVVWGLCLLIGAIPAVLKLLRADRVLA